MRRFFYVFGTVILIGVLIGSCASAPEQTDRPKDGEVTEDGEKEVSAGKGGPAEGAEALVGRWKEAIENRDLERFISFYWEDARLDVINRDGSSDSFLTAAAIKEHQRRLFESFGSGPIDLPEPQFHEQPHPDRILYRVEYEFGVEFIFCQKRDDEWKISRQEIIMEQPGRQISSKLQADADLNGDGFLQPEEEFPVLVEEILMPLLAGPHRAETSADRLFDINGDGTVDEREVDRARRALFIENPLYIAQFDAGPLVHHFDVNRDGRVTEDELRRIIDFLFGDPALREPRPVENGFERFLDDNGDGRLTEQDFIEMEWRFYIGAGTQRFRDETVMEVPREVTNSLDSLADGNGDGRVDEKEQQMLLEALAWEHPVETFVGIKLDENKNGYLDFFEIARARQLYAMGKKEIVERARPPYPTETALDGLLDRDRSGTVTEDEIEQVVRVFAGDREGGRLPEDLMELFDHNRNGEVEEFELQDSAHFFMMAHPADPDFWLDRELDRNRDGFVEPVEVGIPAGVTRKGPTASFRERLELARWEDDSGERRPQGEEKETAAALEDREEQDKDSFQSEYYEKLGMIQDKKLAVVGINIGTKQIDRETANGLIVFVENAFVNIGKVRVVDRQNIEKIMEEHKFQSSAITDESTAVEIGKLSGADIIVMGSIHYVGNLHYLNIKLINVETGEIIGSSIAEADSDSEFLDMCNKAVYNLF